MYFESVWFSHLHRFFACFFNLFRSLQYNHQGHEKRRTVYNLYHILNHAVLFGGSYMSQARDMIDEILRS